MKLAILDDYQNAALSAADWKSLGPDIDTTVFNDHLGWDEAHIAQKLEPFEIIVAMRERTPFPATLLAALPKLKLLATTGMRNLSIDMDAARDAGIVVTGTRMLPYPAAEHALALMMELTKKIARENAIMHDGGWQQTIPEGLNGKTLGIIGLGNLGGRMARFGLALEMEVLAWSENLTQARCDEIGVTLADKETLFRQSDVISIHTVLSDRTRGLVGADDLARMKPTAYLINTSRGPVVDEAALEEALKRGAIAGAGIDVYAVEPLPADASIRSLDNAVLTGHTAYVIKEFFALSYGEVVENIAAWRAGAPIRVLNEG
ncbi:MAG: D-2-hydroxyacid dehydrogenase family protein [Hyphomicrobiales bacterium]|nr:D-2-hydroxyacid dehydrogenase family protein [Hyphomicrobiales bacterium]